jgi:hypothetical protein
MKQRIEAVYLRHQVLLRVAFVLGVAVILAVVGGAPGAGSGGPSAR